MCKVFLGSRRYKRPNSSPLYVSFSLYLDKTVGRHVSFHAFVISGVADLDSPDTSLNAILYRVFQWYNQPSDAWNLSTFNCFAKPRVLSCKIFPLIGMISDLCISNHFQEAKLTYSYFPSFIYCLLVSPLLLNAANIFCSVLSPPGQGVFWDIEFFRDIFVGKPSVNFYQCFIFHAQCMFVVTSPIPCNAGHFFKITTTATLLQNKILWKHF